MNTVTVSDIKKHGAKSLSDSTTQILIVNSRPKSAIVPIRVYEMLLNTVEELADKHDVSARASETTFDEKSFFAQALK